MENSDDIDDFLKQLKKKKKRTDKITKNKVINEVPKVVDDVKEEDIDVFVTQRKSTKLQKLAAMHSNSDKLYSSLEDDYEVSSSKPKPKRIFNYTPKSIDEPRIKPVVVDAHIDEKENLQETQLKDPAVTIERHTNPDLYFGVSTTLKALNHEENETSSKKPIFDEKIQTVGVELPLDIQNSIDNH